MSPEHSSLDAQPPVQPQERFLMDRAAQHAVRDDALPTQIKQCFVTYINLPSGLKHCSTCLEQAIFNDNRSLHLHKACQKHDFISFVTCLSELFMKELRIYTSLRCTSSFCE